MDNISMAVGIPGITKNSGARKYIWHFSELLDTKQKTDVHILRSDQTERKEIRTWNVLCYTIQNKKGYTNVNACEKKLCMIRLYSIQRL